MSDPLQKHLDDNFDKSEKAQEIIWTLFIKCPYIFHRKNKVKYDQREIQLFTEWLLENPDALMEVVQIMKGMR